ncbi:unnamed protein product [Microthlaspi erraticum]|uniref:Uncharacterized protein n=1 Tax=Microthlaspi erraticum TaxID=1685480 RepID=A0A6D2KQC0_9BRAS|nr:unnamed protein product [Microthlaspi erraticum]CAA7030573.1 unnamed protein product [Microthlaspi erraticum]CAA7045744.1 unnamed protein product [Microthlaspi erraticum]CAA7055891.1 unnamed protein product [Microthlaspi erraticum]CAA7059053.1 unnamed protein product [Microthlaspi erraticum]
MGGKLILATFSCPCNLGHMWLAIRQVQNRMATVFVDGDKIGDLSVQQSMDEDLKLSKESCVDKTSCTESPVQLAAKVGLLL